MALWTPRKVKNTLTALITQKGDDCEVREILSSPELHNSVMYETEELIGFFAPPAGEPPTDTTTRHLYELTSWAFTDCNIKDRFDFRLSRNAANMISDSSRQVLDRFLYPNSPLVKSLANFLGSHHCRHSVFCGHFQRIFESSLRATSGDLLFREPFSTRFPTPLDFFTRIVGRIREMSFKLMLIHAISDVPDVFADGLLGKVLLALVECGRDNAGRSRSAPVKEAAAPCEESPHKNVRIFDEPKKPTEPPRRNIRPKTLEHYEATIYAVLSTIQGLLEENGDIVGELRKGEIVRPLIEIGMLVHRDSPVLQMVCRWVNAIVKGDSESEAPLPNDVETVLANFRNRGSLGIALKKKMMMFQILGGKDFGLMMELRAVFLKEPPVNDAFNSVYLGVIRSMDYHQLDDFLSADDGIFVKTLVANIAPMFDDGATVFNGQLIDLAKFLLNKEGSIPFMEPDIWREFAEEFNRHVALPEKGYRQEDGS
jgi:hypothetical protein